jgi:hypothetical protein
MCNCRILARTSAIDDGRVFGTWDFKWPQRYEVEVRFQALPTDQLEALPKEVVLPEGFTLTNEESALIAQGQEPFGKLTRLVECLAQRWLAGSSNPANIRLVFRHDDPVRRASAAIATALEYDVLVSLANLPQDRRGRSSNDEGFTDSVFLPGSELGRYAQRADYSVPTTYLGKRKQYPGPSAQYFGSHEFWHWCVHEFGHVLGLPHEHQNPKVHEKVRAGLKSDQDIARILATALGENGRPNPRITATEIAEEITTPWPAAMIDLVPQYSDFRDHLDLRPDDSSSIMFHIYWQRLLIGSTEEETPRFFERPREGDLKHLLSMYPPV